MRKRLLSIIFVCCLLSALLTVGTTAADDIIAKGDCGADGSNVQWSLDSNGVLTISGKGVMKNLIGPGYLWNDGTPMSHSIPWFDNRNMITSLKVNDGITGISKYAFYGLERLTNATLPDSISSIEDGAFYGCSNLSSFTISDNVSSIGDYAFCGCKRLTKMLIPRNVINIGINAFQSCAVLQSVTMLADIPVVNASTFLYCSALKEITIPHSVVIIDNDAFSGCSALENVYFTGAESLWDDITINSGNQPLENAKVNFNASVKETYCINSISLSDMNGNPLTEIPKSVFF